MKVLLMLVPSCSDSIVCRRGLIYTPCTCWWKGLLLVWLLAWCCSACYWFRPTPQFFIVHLHGHDGLLKISGKVFALDPMFKDTVVDHIKGLLCIKADHMEVRLGVFCLSYCLSKAQGGHVWWASPHKAKLKVMINVPALSGCQQGVFVYLTHCRCDRDAPVISRFERVLSFLQDRSYGLFWGSVEGGGLVSWVALWSWRMLLNMSAMEGARLSLASYRSSALRTPQSAALLELSFPMALYTMVGLMLVLAVMCVGIWRASSWFSIALKWQSSNCSRFLGVVKSSL